MARPTFTAQTDLIDDAEAADINPVYVALAKVMRAVAFADYSTATTMSGNLTLTDSDDAFQSLDPNGANREVELPALASTNGTFFIWNRVSATYTITVKDASSNTIVILWPGEAAIVFTDGTNGWGVVRDTLAPRASAVRTVTASGAVDLEDSDPIYIEIDPNGSDRDVNLPAAGGDNHLYLIRNSGAANVLTIKLDGGSSITTVQADKIKLLVPSDAEDFTFLTIGNSGATSLIPGGRLTLTSGTPVTTSDVTGATNVFYTPYKSNRIPLWNGVEWESVEFSEKTLALGTLTSGLPYDVFGYLNNDTLALEKLAWTNGTTRATGISLQDGRYCKTGDKTRLYLGTFYTTSTTETEDSENNRFLFNVYNRVSRHLVCTDPTNNWNYTTATWRPANNNTTIGVGRFAIIIGLDEEELRAHVHSTASNDTGTTAISAGVGIDSTSTNSAQVYGGGTASAGILGETTAEYLGLLGIGYHYIQRLEIAQASGTTTWYGDLNISYHQTGMIGSIKM